MTNSANSKSTPTTKSVTSRITEQVPAPGDAFAQRPKVRALIAEISTASDERFDQMIAAAQRLRDLRADFEAERSTIGLTWYEWGRIHLKVKDKNRLALLARIADAKTRNAQEAIIRVERKKQNDRQSDWREKNKAAEEKKEKAPKKIADARRKLIAWAETAPRNEIDKTWTYLKRAFMIAERAKPKRRSTRKRAAKPRKRKKHD